MSVPRYLISRLFEQITNNDLVDKWDYPVQAGREFILSIKSGNELSPENNFLQPSRFSRYNSISCDRVFEILYPAFEEFKEQIVDSLVSDFERFLVRLKSQIQTTHAKSIYSSGNPNEDLGRQIVSAAVFGYFEREGFVYHEVPSGIGFIDILICVEREIVIEAKLHRNFDLDSKQLDEYVRIGHNRHGYYIVFDTTRSFTNQIYCDIENGRFPAEDRYSVIVCHVNPPPPSSK